MSVDLLPAVVQKAQLSETALTLDANLTPDEWEEIGHSLGRANRASGWWIGDWINYGEDAGYVTRGKYEAAEQVTGLARETLKNYAAVARNFKSSRRRDDLIFGHHASGTSSDDHS